MRSFTESCERNQIHLPLIVTKHHCPDIKTYQLNDIY